MPKRIHSDQGQNFEGELLKDCVSCKGFRSVGLQHIIRWEIGSAKGLIVLCTIYCVPCPLKRKGHGLSAYHSYFLHNTPAHQSTGYSPYELLFGQKPKLPVDAQSIPQNRVSDSLDFQFPMEQVIDPSESSLGQPPIVEQIVYPRELNQRSMGSQVEVAMCSPDHLEQEQEELLYIYSIN